MPDEGNVEGMRHDGFGENNEREEAYCDLSPLIYRKTIVSRCNRLDHHLFDFGNFGNIFAQATLDAHFQGHGGTGTGAAGTL